MAAVVASLPLLALLLAACGGDSPSAEPEGEPGTAVGGSAVAALDIPADAPLVIFLGDSVAAGLHLPGSDAFPAVVQRDLFAAGVPFRLVNAGISGGTTAGGLSRLDWLLRQKPAVVVVELGANDGFRGTPLETVEDNLRRILRGVQDAGAVPLLLGIRLPPNYGRDYVEGFDDLYPRLAEELSIPFVPFFMEGVAGRITMNLPDGIHPTAEGHRRLAKNLAPELRKLLE